MTKREKAQKKDMYDFRVIRFFCSIFANKVHLISLATHRFFMWDFFCCVDLNVFSAQDILSSNNNSMFSGLQICLRQEHFLWRKILALYTAWNVSTFGIILVLIFPHLDWIRRDTLYLSVFSANEGKWGPE